MSRATIFLLCLRFISQTWSRTQIPFPVGVRLCHILCLASGSCNVEFYYQDALSCITSTGEKTYLFRENVQGNLCGKQGCLPNYRCLINRRCHHVCVSTSKRTRGQTVSTGSNKVIVTSEPTKMQIHFYAVDLHKTAVRSIFSVQALKITALKAYGSDFFWCQSKKAACGHARYSMFRAATVKSTRHNLKLNDLAVDVKRGVIYGAQSPRSISLFTMSRWEYAGKPFRLMWTPSLIELDSDRKSMYVSNTVNNKIEVFFLNKTRRFTIDYFTTPIRNLYLDVTGNTLYASQDHFIECLELEKALSLKNMEKYRPKGNYTHIRACAANGIMMVALDRYLKVYMVDGVLWKDTNHVKRLPNKIAVESPIALLEVPEYKGTIETQKSSNFNFKESAEIRSIPNIGHIDIRAVTVKSSKGVGGTIENRTNKGCVIIPEVYPPDQDPAETVLISTRKTLHGKVHTTLYSMDLRSGSVKTKHAFPGRLVSMDMQNDVMFRCQEQRQGIVQTDFSKPKPLDNRISSYRCITITMDWKKNIVFILKKSEDYIYYFNIWPLHTLIRKKITFAVARRFGTHVTIFTDKLLHNLHVYKHGYKRLKAYSYSGTALPPKRMKTLASDVVYKSQDHRLFYLTTKPKGMLRSGVFGPKDKLMHFLRLISPTPVAGFAVSKSFIITAVGRGYDVYHWTSSKSIRKGRFKWTNFKLHSLDHIKP